MSCLYSGMNSSHDAYLIYLPMLDTGAMWWLDGSMISLQTDKQELHTKYTPGWLECGRALVGPCNIYSRCLSPSLSRE